MTNFIPIFPLGIVVYPGEQLNLHIFEPRYKQLITECHQNKRPFGIPTMIDGKLTEMGTLVEVLEISQLYDDGKMDIKTGAIKVFRILEVIKELPEKLYSSAIVNYPDNTEGGNRSLMQKLIAALKELHDLLKLEKEFNKPEDELWSYDVAHHAGLSLIEEYELLQLMNELQRQEYLKRHLAKVTPVMAEMEALRSRIKMNGHFKALSGSDI